MVELAQSTEIFSVTSKSIENIFCFKDSDIIFLFAGGDMFDIKSDSNRGGFILDISYP